jgi:hypothetical protein
MKEEQEPLHLDRQVNFHAWLGDVVYTSTDKRVEELAYESSSEVTTMRDTLYTKFEMEAGYWDSDEFEKKAFDFYKELYPDHVIYPIQYLHNDEFKLQAKIAQTLKFIGNGTIKLTPDQVTTPDNPDQYEVMKVLFKIKTEKELYSFIRSATIDANEFSKEGVDELLGQLNNTPTLLSADNPDNNYYSVDLSGDLSNLGSHDSYDDMIDHMVETAKDENVAFYLSGKDIQDENWLSKLKELKENQGFSITDDFGFYPLPEYCQSNEDAEKYMAKEMDGKVDLNKWLNGTFVEWISFNKRDQWLGVINDSLPCANKEFTPEATKALVDQLANEADGGVEILVENIMNGYPEEYILDAVPSTIKTLLEGALAAKRKTKAKAKAEKSDIEVAKPTANTP